MENIKIKQYFVNEEDAINSADDTLKQIFNKKIMTIENIKEVIKYFRNLESQNNIEIFNQIEQTISSSESALVKIQEMLAQIFDLELVAKQDEKEWTKLTKEINAYGTDLNKLMLCNRNITLLKTNIDIYFKNIVDNQVEDLRKLMNSSEKNIVYVYKNVRYLSFLRKIFLDKVKSLNTRSDKLNNVADHLLKVKQLESDFFSKFFKYFDNVLQLAEENPALLVKLLRLIEEDSDFVLSIKLQLESEINKKKITQEIIDKREKIESNYNNIEKNPGSSVSNKIRSTIHNQRESRQYKVTNFNKENNNDKVDMKSFNRETVQYAIEDDSLNYEIIVDYIIRSIHLRFEEEFKEKSSINLVLDSTHVYAAELVKVFKVVAPCFPKKYEIFDVFKVIYLDEIRNLISPFLDQIKENEQKNSANTILLARWLDKFDETLKTIGIEVAYSDLGAEIKYVLNFYIDYISDELDKYIDRILEMNLQSKLAFRNKKNLQPSEISSNYASDVFKTVFGLIEALCNDIRGDIMLSINSLVIDKLKNLEKLNQQNVSKLNHPDDIITACVYILDADNCVEEFPSYKKKMKELLNESYHNNLKDKFSQVKKEYTESIRKSSEKVVELIFYEIELSCLSKLFSSKWNDEVLQGTFENFRIYFKGFTKLFKNQNILLMIVRTFIIQFCEYYVEEIIHSVRSIFRKEKKQKDPYNIFNYQFKRLKCLEDDEEIKIIKEKEEEAIRSRTGAAMTKEEKEGKYEMKDNKHHKYSFPIKTLEEAWKKPNFKKVKELLEADCRLFSAFLDGFKEKSLNPFSKNFDLKLDTFVGGQINKLAVLSKILTVEENQLKQTIEAFYKEYYFGEDGKALLDALLFLRPIQVKDDLRKLCIKCLN
jgi:hypothetical protein